MRNIQNILKKTVLSLFVLSVISIILFFWLNDKHPKQASYINIFASIITISCIITSYVWLLTIDYNQHTVFRFKIIFYSSVALYIGFIIYGFIEPAYGSIGSYIFYTLFFLIVHTLLMFFYKTKYAPNKKTIYENIIFGLCMIPLILTVAIKII